MIHPPLYIMRHGETEWNRAGRWQGREDSPLTELGVAQARDQGGLLRDLALDPAEVTFFASPQGRAARTAELVAEAAGWQGGIIPDDRLAEIDVGAWTGLNRHEIRAGVDLPEGGSFLDLYAMAPEGEPFSALEARVRGFLADLQGPAIIVTHGITSRFLRAVVLGTAEDDIASFAADLPGGQGVIHRIEACTHATLAPPDAPA